MRYLGGKTRNSKAITEILKSYQKNSTRYIEPFCGGLSIAERMDSAFEYPMNLSDVHKGLITLYKSIQNKTFAFPERNLTVKDYKWYKEHGSQEDPLYTAIGFGLSYAGKWWGGYDSYYDNRGKQGETTRSLTNSLKKTFSKPHIEKAHFWHKSYVEWKEPKDCLIYCDPPYANTTAYKGTDQFDHNYFWSKVRHWSKKNTVITSEFNAPDDFECIWSAPYKVQMCKQQQQVTEKLFKWKG